MALVWDDSLSIGDDEIDHDHKILLELANRILSAAQLSAEKEALAVLIGEYIDYTAIHFSHEECLMIRLGYPDKDEHIAAHSIFFERLCILISAFKRNESGVRNKMMALFATYTFNHIVTFDRDLADWCHQHHPHEGIGGDRKGTVVG